MSPFMLHLTSPSSSCECVVPEVTVCHLIFDMMTYFNAGPIIPLMAILLITTVIVSFFLLVHQTLSNHLALASIYFSLHAFNAAFFYFM